MYIVLIAIAAVILIFFGSCYGAYWYTFRRVKARQAAPCDVPGSEYKETIVKNILALMDTPFEAVTIKSHDNLKLFGRYYHFKDGAPIAILFHGYRSTPFRDGSGGFRVCRDYGLNVLLCDQRAHGKSEGKTITFGVKERLDCMEWIKYLKERFGNDTKLLLVGLSMGAATVMMASDIVPAENVKGIVADCGFSSPKEILTDVAKQMKLPPKLSYFFLKLGARIFGGFNPEEATSVDSLKKSSVPILFIHGEGDTFVPCNMSRDCHEASVSEKHIFTVPKAAHGMSYYVDTPGYTATVTDFLNKIL